MPNATICGGAKVSVQEIANLLSTGLQDSVLPASINLVVDRRKATALARLTDAPGRIRSILYFSGWMQPIRDRSGIRASTWILELYANEGTTGAAASANAAVLTDTDLLAAAEDLATAMESLEFPGYDMCSPALQSSSWMLAEDGTTLSGHSLTFSVIYCHPVRQHVQVAAPEPPTGTGFRPIS